LDEYHDIFVVLPLFLVNFFTSIIGPLHENVRDAR